MIHTRGQAEIEILNLEYWRVVAFEYGGYFRGIQAS